MDNNARKKDVLKFLVETFVHTNQPVGSMQIAEQVSYEVSSATIRNDMVELTALGLLSQPHTSAGRIPTDKGYQHYVKILIEERKQLSRKQQEVLTRHFKNLKNLQERYKAAAKMLAELSGSVGFLMDDSKNIYMSGLGNMARLPEFSDESFRVDLMQALEQPEELIGNLALDSEDINVMIGEDNNIGKATIVISNFGSQGKKIISIIGPTRMQYKKALPLIDYIKKILDE